MTLENFNLKVIGLFLVLSLVINVTVGIKKLSNCAVELDDGRKIDLSSLDNPNSPR